jgi:hypothetical protein
VSLTFSHHTIHFIEIQEDGLPRLYHSQSFFKESIRIMSSVDNVTFGRRPVTALFWAATWSLLISPYDCGVEGFSVPFVHDTLQSVSSSVSIASSVAAVDGGDFFHHWLGVYTHSLAVHPLETKMATGGVLAVTGDAIAQTSQQLGQQTDDDGGENDVAHFDYDVRRAASFMVFDMSYRALQHAAFPIIVQQCHGQFLGRVLSVTAASQVFHSNVETMTSYWAAMEQTLASQLGIVPFLYYPVFFALTGAVQGLDMEAAIQRAQENFVPLMKRNLLFWIPVQFIQFGFIETSLQIPFLSICGLCWTFILSIYAGSTKQYNNNTNTETTSTTTMATEVMSDDSPLIEMIAKSELISVDVLDERLEEFVRMDYSNTIVDSDSSSTTPNAQGTRMDAFSAENGTNVKETQNVL